MLTRDALTKSAGKTLGCSAWVEVTQARIDGFADLTEDRQAIHLDAYAARAAGFSGTVAHGFLTLSLLSKMAGEVLPEVEGQRASVNYGFDRIRFVAPVPAGARLRAHFVLDGVEPRGCNLLLCLGVKVEFSTCSDYEGPGSLGIVNAGCDHIARPAGFAVARCKGSAF